MKKLFWLLLFAYGCASQGDTTDTKKSTALYTKDDSSLSVSWNFDENVKAVVEFGTSKNDLNMFAYDASITNFGKSGQINLLGVNSDTKYYFRIKGTNVSQEVSYTAIDSISTSSNLPNENYFIFVTMDVSRDGSGISWGDALFIQTPSGTNVIIDAGPETSQSTTNIRQVLQSYGVTKIDYAFVTHDHADHYRGFTSSIFSSSNFPISEFYYPHNPSDFGGIGDLVGTLQARGTQTASAIPGTKNSSGNYLQWENGDFEAEIVSSGLGREVGNSSSDVNNDSIVLYVRYKNAEYVLTGDFEVDGQAVVNFPQADVLKVPHHGRLDGTSDKMLNEITPLVGVISTVNDGLFEPNVLNAYSRHSIDVYRTDKPNPEENSPECFSNVYSISDGETIVFSYECIN